MTTHDDIENAMYSIAVFAYNEEASIGDTINSIVANTDDCLAAIHVLANGCTDKTANVARKLFADNEHINGHVVEITVGDKCNAWNEYVYNHLPDCAAHFFVDSDVTFTKSAFPVLAAQLAKTGKNAVTGLPQSGRNIETYTELVVRYGCLFGNLYALRHDFLTRLKTEDIKLPVGLCWIDAQITKLVNEDLRSNKDGYQKRVTYLEGTGYLFNSLKPQNKDDRKLYLSRIARYKAGQLQEPYLDALPFTEWPDNMNEINQKILNQPIGFSDLGWKVIFKQKILKRLNRKY